MTNNSDIPRIPYRKQVYISQDGEAYLTASGDLSLGYARIYAPSSEKIREMLLRLRRDQGWSRATLAAVLGVPKHTLRRWEDRSRSPCGSSKKLIWLVHMLFFRPEELLKDLDNLVTWGHGKEETLVLDDDDDPTQILDKGSMPHGSGPGSDATRINESEIG
jgi:DNA-binding transcriptional regulator YiaG